MATQIKISELPLANESALSLAADDRFIFNNDNVNTQTIKFANFVDAICEQNLTFTGNCSFLQPIVGPDGGDIQVGLDDLVDVQFQNVQAGQLIQYGGGGQWINVDVADVTVQLGSLSVDTAATAAGGGALAYDNTTGVFTFTPAVQNTFAKTDLSVTIPPASSGQGNLVYDNVNGVFTFTKPDSYTKAETYSQAEVDAALNGKADVGDSYLKTETYTTTQIDTAIAGKVAYTDLSVTVGTASGQGNLVYDDMGGFTFTPADVYTAAQVDSTFALQANTYTTTQVDTALAAKADLDDVYTQTEVDTALTTKADAADAALTGTPTAPTAAAGTNTTQVATTAFVGAAVTANNAAYISIADLQTLVAAAGDYAAFQTAIGAL